MDEIDRLARTFVDRLAPGERVRLSRTRNHRYIITVDGASMPISRAYRDELVAADRAVVEDEVSVATRQHVLVIDDHADGAEALAMFLRSLGHATMVAHDGESALTIVGSVRPTVVIVDIALGTMDGLTLASQLRARLGAEVPIFVLSALSSAEYRRRADDIGINAYFVKPADVGALEAALAAL